MTTRRQERAPMNVTRRVAIKAGLGAALSALSLWALRVDGSPQQWRAMLGQPINRPRSCEERCRPESRFRKVTDGCGTEQSVVA
jgi:hypothetical protein